jgi:5-methylcytosine-specific restriction endonuclease McrA
VVVGYGCHHIIERRLGGPDTHENLETLCKAHLTSADLRGAVARRSG